jgi:DNA-directed RNA polymerase specialized sigma24 family protein
LTTDSSSHDLTSSATQRGKWVLTQEAFDCFLASLGDDRDLAGQQYLEIRGNLIRFFEWRSCPFPEDHADETINRVARKLSEGEIVRNASAYCLGVARLLVLEIIKARVRERQVFGDMAISDTVSPDEPDSESRIECLRQCLQKLSSENRDLIVNYYQGSGGKKIENRKKLTESLGIPVNTLRMRALRLREKLQLCVETCLNR